MSFITRVKEFLFGKPTCFDFSDYFQINYAEGMCVSVTICQDSNSLIAWGRDNLCKKDKITAHHVVNGKITKLLTIEWEGL